MSGWSQEDLARVGEAEEIGIASVRPDGTVRPYVTIWAVRVGDDLYVRSAYGSANPWFRRARESGTGRIRAGGVERDVTFADAQTDARLVKAMRTGKTMTVHGVDADGGAIADHYSLAGFIAAYRRIGEACGAK